ncbi:MAG: nitroreductase family protein [Elusimicrobia bacterium]|nr:nitroreductase family protein [Elusimicrobiota bacterium]
MKTDLLEKDGAAAPEALLGGLRRRYATKRFDPDRKIPGGLWDALEEALVLSQSSYGLQPWRFFVVDDPALRARLRPVSWNQAQITDADRLVVFAARKDLGAHDVERYIARIAHVRKVPASSLDGFKQMMLGSLSKSKAELQAWSARQVYIALGNFLAAAAALGVDACPMEGFDAAKYDEILGLSEKGYTAVVLAAAGYRAGDDHAAALPKVRFERADVVEHL